MAERKQLVGLGEGSVSMGGQEIHLALKFDGGSTLPVSMSHEMLPPLVTALRTCGDIAVRTRLGVGGAALEELVQPFAVRNFRFGASVGEPPATAIEFSTEQGMPVQIAMPRPLAERLVSKLEEFLRPKMQKRGRAH
jgi:hypothetical protein